MLSEKAMSGVRKCMDVDIDFFQVICRQYIFFGYVLENDCKIPF